MKRKFILLPITLTTIGATIGMVGCSNPNTPEEETNFTTTTGQMSSAIEASFQLDWANGHSLTFAGDWQFTTSTGTVKTISATGGDDRPQTISITFDKEITASNITDGKLAFTYNDLTTKKDNISTTIENICITKYTPPGPDPKQEYSVLIDSSRLEHIIDEPVVTKIFGSDIKIECNMLPNYMLDKDKIEVYVNTVSYCDFKVDDEGKIITITKDDSWTTSTAIGVTLYEKEATYNVSVDSSAFPAYVTEEPVVTKTFGGDIKIECNFPDYYVLVENDITVYVNGETYKNFKVDDSGKVLTITKDVSWTVSTPIVVTLAGKELSYENIDIDATALTHITLGPTIKLNHFGKNILIICSFKQSYVLDQDNITIFVGSTKYTNFLVNNVGARNSLLDITPDSAWTTQTAIAITLAEKVS